MSGSVLTVESLLGIFFLSLSHSLFFKDMIPYFFLFWLLVLNNEPPEPPKPYLAPQETTSPPREPLGRLPKCEVSLPPAGPTPTACPRSAGESAGTAGDRPTVSDNPTYTSSCHSASRVFTPCLPTLSGTPGRGQGLVSSLARAPATCALCSAENRGAPACSKKMWTQVFALPPGRSSLFVSATIEEN